MPDLPYLFLHEREALLEALRRDLRTESRNFFNRADESDIHGQNVRHIVRLLELLNPRQARRTAYELVRRAA